MSNESSLIERSFDFVALHDDGFSELVIWDDSPVEPPLDGALADVKRRRDIINSWVFRELFVSHENTKYVVRAATLSTIFRWGRKKCFEPIVTREGALVFSGLQAQILGAAGDAVCSVCSSGVPKCPFSALGSAHAKNGSPFVSRLQCRRYDFKKDAIAENLSFHSEKIPRFFNARRASQSTEGNPPIARNPQQ